MSPRAHPFLLAALLGGCAHSPAPAPAPADAESARREERRKIMQEYWYDHTLAPQRATETGVPAPVDYPAGTYSGINFGPRRAPDPGLEEPVR